MKISLNFAQNLTKTMTAAGHSGSSVTTLEVIKLNLLGKIN